MHKLIQPKLPLFSFKYTPRPVPIALVRRVDGRIQQVPLVGYGGKPDPEDDPKKNRNGIWIACYIVGYIAWHLFMLGQH